jgi:hypothetical protein
MWCVPMFSNPTGTTYSWSSERATRVWTLPTSVVFPGLSGVPPGYGARNSLRVWSLGVDAWPELMDAILTELSGR